ncbi:MAG: hypothetical protein H6832_13985 [Planctomycetes bacterium]|nr:hypothetical protein [Planctomycetota bacterium]MCB9919507.1 hypothetical protein [Planctomycetota bacterium]
MSTKKSTMARALALALATSCTSLVAQDGEKKVTLDKVPQAVQKAIREKVGKGRLVDIGKYEKDGKAVYEIEMVVDGKEYDVLFREDGSVVRKSLEGEKSEKRTETQERGEKGEKNERENRKEEDEDENEEREERKSRGERKEGKRGRDDEEEGDEEGEEHEGRGKQKEGKRGRDDDDEEKEEGDDEDEEHEGRGERKEGKQGRHEEGDEEEGDEEDSESEHAHGAHASATRFQTDFCLETRELTTVGRSRFFVLEPGYRLVLEGKDDEGTPERLTITVLDETRLIGGFETRVVEERETKNGELVEISRNFVAMCPMSKSVFYFGEEVDIYENGDVIGHKGAWIHGRDGARAGLMMPGEPVLGAAYYEELAPKVAMDRARIHRLDAVVATPVGILKNCLEVFEENQLDGEKEYKRHAPGIGLVQDENLVLVEYGFVKKG